MYQCRQMSCPVSSSLPGIGESTSGAEVDSPDLNITALTFAETRLRYLLFVLYILFELYILSVLCLLCVLYTFILNNFFLSCQDKAYEAQCCGGP